MITKFKLFESFDNVIQDSYNDYMKLQSDELSDWLERFKDEKIVLDVLPKIIINEEDPYGEEQW